MPPRPPPETLDDARRGDLRRCVTHSVLLRRDEQCPGCRAEAADRLARVETAGGGWVR